MPHARQRQPISKELARIVRDGSGLQDVDAPVSKHLQAIEDRRAQALEFYLRSCAMRLDTSL